jgi:hypothetical protein
MPAQRAPDLPRQESLSAVGAGEGWGEGYRIPFYLRFIKGDAIPLTPASGPLLPSKDLFAGLLEPTDELQHDGGALGGARLQQEVRPIDLR